jgi:hypothetical protein
MRLPGWIAGFVEQTGAVRTCAPATRREGFSLIPSELIITLAGFTAARSVLGKMGAVLVGLGGSVLGSRLGQVTGDGLVRVMAFVETQHRRVGDRLEPVSNDVIGALVL